MPAHETILSKQEKKWISERRVTRLTDNKEVQIYPMGAEKYLSSVLFKKMFSSFLVTAIADFYLPTLAQKKLQSTIKIRSPLPG